MEVPSPLFMVQYQISNVSTYIELTEVRIYTYIYTYLCTYQNCIVVAVGDIQQHYSSTYNGHKDYQCFNKYK